MLHGPFSGTFVVYLNMNILSFYHILGKFSLLFDVYYSIILLEDFNYPGGVAEKMISTLPV